MGPDAAKLHVQMCRKKFRERWDGGTQFKRRNHRVIPLCVHPWYMYIYLDIGVHGSRCEDISIAMEVQTGHSCLVATDGPHR